MSRLQLFGRPWVVFDPSNKDHRRYFAEFQATCSWGQCPVRFVVDNDHGDLITMIQRQLIDYYVTKEFDTGGRLRHSAEEGSKTVAKKPRRPKKSG